MHFSKHLLRALYYKIQRRKSTCEDRDFLFTKFKHFYTVPWHKVCNRRQHSTIIMVTLCITRLPHTHKYLCTCDTHRTKCLTIGDTSCSLESQTDVGHLMIQPVVQTNGSSRSSTGRVLLSVSMLSSVWFSTMWQRFNWWDSSCTLPSFSAYLAYFLCRSVISDISLETSESICRVATYISTSHLN